MATRYKKGQVGWLFLAMLGIMIGIVVLSFLLIEQKEQPDYSVLVNVGIFLLLIALCFYKLTVIVADRSIKLIYGIGLIRITIRPQQITTLKAVKTPFYLGYGIRFTFKGMLYNIQGNKAVQLQYTNGKKRTVRIGTAEPDELIEAIENEFSIVN